MGDETGSVEVRNVVWDMDGTLLDSTTMVPAAFVRAVAALNGRPVDVDDVVASYWRGTPEVIMSFLVGRELEPAEHEVYYQELDGVAVAAYPGVAETLNVLRGQGLPVTVFTGASTRAARILLRAANIAADVVIGGDQVGKPKPAPDGVLLAAHRLAVAPDQLVLVGDSPLDLRAAKAAGSHSASAAWGHMYDPTEPADITLTTPKDALHLLRPG